MRAKKSVLFVVLAPSLLACVADTDVPEEGELDLGDQPAAEAEPRSSETSAFCGPSPIPPPADRFWTLSASNPTDSVVIDPANGECDDYVINARNVETMVAAVTDPATDPDKCVGTSITIQRYEKGSDSSWTAEGAVTATGVWTITGCRLPIASWTAHTQSDARIQIRTKRTYTSGMYTVTLHGLRFQATAHVYEPPAPPS